MARAPVGEVLRRFKYLSTATERLAAAANEILDKCMGIHDIRV